MELIKSFESQRLIFRTLNPKLDNFDNYLKWMKDVNSNKFIHGVRTDMHIEELFEYVRNKNNNDESLLLGIFTKESNFHIGNIKLEPLKLIDSLTWLGLLIGESTYRGRGFGLETLNSVLDFAYLEMDIKFFNLGVDIRNEPAIKLYTKVGFTMNTSVEHTFQRIMTFRK
jgi:ribosomal-protein-alanine N-acetyltransferase